MEMLSGSLIMLSRPPRLTLNFRDADIKVVIDMIARVSGANIIVSPDVKGQITMSINNVPWARSSRPWSATLKFTTVKEAFGIIRIIHPDELLKQMDTRVFQLKYISPPAIYSAKVEAGKTLAGQPLQPPTSIEELIRRFVLAATLPDRAVEGSATAPWERSTSIPRRTSSSSGIRSWCWTRSARSSPSWTGSRSRSCWT